MTRVRRIVNNTFKIKIVYTSYILPNNIIQIIICIFNTFLEGIIISKYVIMYRYNPLWRNIKEKSITNNKK